MTTCGPVHCTLDLSASGRQVGRLELPRSTNTSGWSHLFIPIATVGNGDGPTVVVLAGNHGDEYEGQIAALKLLRHLDEDDVSGRVIIIPCLSPQASSSGTRLWPSGANFNRSFPGRPDGPPNEQLAHFLTTVLMPMSDVVIDIHTGGRSARFVPCSHMHWVEKPEQRREMREGCRVEHRLPLHLHRHRRLRTASERSREPGQDGHHHRAWRRRVLLRRDPRDRRAGPGQRAATSGRPRRARRDKSRLGPSRPRRAGRS